MLRLVHRTDFTPSEAGGPYCDFDNPLDFAAPVNHGVDGFEFPVI